MTFTNTRVSHPPNKQKKNRIIKIGILGTGMIGNALGVKFGQGENYQVA